MPACGTYTCRLPSCWTALEKNLHFVHMVYTMALVEDTLPEISEWLERHPREVVILACRIFQGLSEDLHDYLISCIKTIFGEMLCPRGEGCLWAASTSPRTCSTSWCTHQSPRRR
ncbi:PI-PLC X domain-containing protein 1-like isoform X2 [Aotus nancymaae]|uniref:PI-PLC X domain-containing protein 1-like isoform X2 n=1 Tax=Aotus nancymaae TaxID=37293 RepID=UPI0030FE27E3